MSGAMVLLCTRYGVLEESLMKDWESMRLELQGHSYCDDLCEFGSSFDVQLESVHVENYCSLTRHICLVRL